jgi:hypothetical protein
MLMVLSQTVGRETMAAGGFQYGNSLFGHMRPIAVSGTIIESPTGNDHAAINLPNESGTLWFRPPGIDACNTEY